MSTERVNCVRNDLEICTGKLDQPSPEERRRTVLWLNLIDLLSDIKLVLVDMNRNLLKRDG